MNYRTFFLILFTVLAVSCGKKKLADTQGSIDSLAANEVFMRNDQLEMAEVKMGKMEKRILSAIIECNGTVEVPPGYYASIHPPMAGYVAEAYFFPGNYVEKGTVLAVLENPDFIVLQRDFLETKSQLAFYESEYRRQGELTLGNASSMKQMQLSEAEYMSRKARLQALAAQLSLLGIDPDKITADAISSRIKLKAPISGYIVRVEASIGKYADPATVLYEIVDKSHLHINLKVFEKDISKIKKGQKVDFTITGFPESFQAEVEATGQFVTDEERMVDVHCHIKKSTPDIIPGMYVRAQINLRNDPVYCLPATSLVREDRTNYVFVRHGNRFVRVPVITGVEQEDYTEIIHPSDSLLEAEIVVRGAYYLAALLSERE
ncbi:MAG: efflux RND transporter periplasmic adaptor subunit [Bacteroidales bacterium]